LLDLLLGMVLTPATTDRLLTEVNARLRAQATASRPRLQELKRALAHVNREIANYTRAVARGDFVSLEGALKDAETRRATLVAELEEIQRKQAPGMLQVMPAVLHQHLQGLTEKLRKESGTGKKARKKALHTGSEESGKAGRGESGTESGTLHTGSAGVILLLPCRAKPASMRLGSCTT
jgi:hypothetical protein